MKAITTSMRSAEWISVRSWLPTLGSPGAFVSSVVSSSGMSGSGMLSAEPSGSLALIARSTRPGFDRRVAAAPESLDAGVDLLDELARERDAGGDALVVAQCGDRPLNDAAQVERDAIGGLGGSQLGRSRLEALPELAEARRERLRDEDLVETALVPRHSRGFYSESPAPSSERTREAERPWRDSGTATAFPSW